MLREDKMESLKNAQLKQWKAVNKEKKEKNNFWD